VSGLHTPRARTLAAALVAASAFLLLLVAVRSGVTGDVDAAGRAATGSATNHDLTSFLRGVEVAFAQPFMTVYVAALAVLLLCLRQPRVALLAVLAMWVTPIVTAAVKAYVGRDRPDWQVSDHTLDSPAFPSGHASATTALVGAVVVAAVVLARTHHWHRAAVPTVMLAGASVVALVGADRILLGRHYPSDVLGGVLLGVAVVLVAAAALDVRLVGQEDDDLSRGS
jgi:membrane-associated phospholipid phosphatase